MVFIYGRRIQITARSVYTFNFGLTIHRSKLRLCPAGTFTYLLPSLLIRCSFIALFLYYNTIHRSKLRLCPADPIRKVFRVLCEYVYGSESQDSSSNDKLQQQDNEGAYHSTGE